MAFSHHRLSSQNADVDRALDARVTGGDLVALAVHRDADVRAAVASRVDAPMATLISLAHESDACIQWALVRNPSSPLWVIQALAESKQEMIRNRALVRLRAAA